MKFLRLLCPPAGFAMVFALAGCSSSEDRPRMTITSVVTVSGAPTTSETPQASSPAASAEPPGPHASFDQIAAWAQSAPEADGRAYQSATQPGQTPPGTVSLGQYEGVAFSSPSGKITCIALFRYDPGLNCQISLEHPLPRPSEGFGNWVGGWAYYTGDSANLGSFHGDPGEFTYGYGAELPYGQKISFGKGSDRYVCRMEQNGLTCVNSAKGSAVLLNDQGVTPYGCLRESDGVGQTAKSYRC